MDIKILSKFLSLILRHKPDIVGISLDEHGWADVEALLRGIQKSGRNIVASLLEKIVAENDKQRFSFSEDRKRIRANQGHSLQVDAGRMFRDGFMFYRSVNGVWLTKMVPTDYLRLR